MTDMTDATSPDIVMYSTGWCPYCDRARGLLQRKGVAFREVKVDEDAGERDTMLKRSGGRRTVPQIFIGDRHVGGYDELYALDKAGEFDKLLGRA
jgi:glutaredoxin 3